jgi:hypothetical protein
MQKTEGSNGPDLNLHTGTLYKITIPLDVVYIHTGNMRDYPVRLAITASQPFLPCGKDVDVIITQELGNSLEDLHCVDAIKGKIHEALFDGNGRSYKKIKVVMNIKFRKLSENYHIPKHAGVVFNIACSIPNDYGRSCWRDGGSCYVSLLELMGNSMMIGQSGSLYAFRKIRLSGYNVKATDRLTGMLGVSVTKDIVPSTTYLRSFYFNDQLSNKRDKEPKWTLLNCTEQCPFFLSEYTSDPQTPSLTTLKPYCLDTKTLISLLYGLNFCFSGDTSPTFQTVPETDRLARLIDPRIKRIPFLTDAKIACREYEEMLSIQNKTVLILDTATRRMNCPYVPMDTCMWEFFSDYSGKGYCEITQPHQQEQSTDKYLDTLLSSMVGSQQQQQQQQTSSSLERLATLNEEYLEKHTMQLFAGNSTPTHVTNLIGGKNTRLLEQVKEALSNNCKDNSEKQIYLPYFAYLLHHPLQVYKEYWNNVLTILYQRKNMPSLAAYQDVYFHKYTHTQRACDAFQMICAYSQAIEYISDFYIPVVGSGTKLKARRQHNTAEGDGRIQIEQFWNSLRAMCADCDDLTLGNAQFYRAFTVDSFKNPQINQLILQQPVLNDMRRLLTCNYIMLFNIEGVFLPRQKVDVNKEHEHAPSTINGHDYSRVDGDYDWDTRDLNSAHADLKLIPKKYFERCVNRACVGSDTPVFLQASTVVVTNNDHHCCDYHAHPPDEFNDSLPVLCGEGTSMLICCDQEEDTCIAEWFKKFVLGDDLLSDTMKSYIYSKRGESDFYKASLFGATLDFFHNHHVSTFTYARTIPNNQYHEHYHIETQFQRGVSYHQLSYKSEKVILVPYGINGNTDGVLNPLCKMVRFPNAEFTFAMYKICVHECKQRIRARKVRNPNKTVRRSCYWPIAVTGNDPVRYNMMDHDTEGNLQGKRERLENWSSALNRIFYPFNDNELRARGDPLHLFVDNYYVSENILRTLTARIQEAVASCPSSWLYDGSGARPDHHPKPIFKTSVALERFSEDMQIWKITFAFFQHVQ